MWLHNGVLHSHFLSENWIRKRAASLHVAVVRYSCLETCAFLHALYLSFLLFKHTKTALPCSQTWLKINNGFFYVTHSAKQISFCKLGYWFCCEHKISLLHRGKVRPQWLCCCFKRLWLPEYKICLSDKVNSACIKIKYVCTAMISGFATSAEISRPLVIC